MRELDFHVFHVSFLDSLISGIQESGAPLDRVVSQCQIKRFDLNSPATYLPIEVCYEFMHKVKYQYGIDHISSFYKSFQVHDLSEYGEYLAHCPDLLTILQNAIKYDYQIQTCGKLKLEINGAVSRFSMVHMDSPSEAKTISEKINMAMFIEAFQFVLGRDWVPLALEVTTSDYQWALDLLPSDNVPVRTNCPEIAAVLKTTDLARKNPSYCEVDLLEEKDLRSASFALNQVLDSMNEGYIPTIEDMATYFGCSRRTILRKIMAGGMSYQEMLQKYIFTKSLHLLKDHRNSVEDISEMLGYANTSNFIRAFKKWTSVTPNLYRKQTILA